MCRFACRLLMTDETIAMKLDSMDTTVPDAAPAAASNTARGVTVGIDLGTTYSAIAWVNPAGQVEILSNADGYITTPSVVFLDGDVVLVGREASKAALLEPDKAAECFKRDMGRPQYSRKVCGEHMRPEVLSSMILRKLKVDAEKKIGPISSAVITVPAYFDDTRRKATEDAGRIAGLEVLAVVNEPVAASIHYGYSHGGSAGEKEQIFLVYDLGGGTFDATLMKIATDMRFDTIATDGDVMLGGKDWDKRLLDHVAGDFMRKVGADPREDDLSYQEMALRVEEYKRTLSKRSSVVIPVSHAGHRLGVTLDRATFRDLTADLLSRTQTTLELLIEEAGISWGDVAKILVVGGASRMPMVTEMLEEVTGREPDACLDADLAVAQGAALYAASMQAKMAATTRSESPLPQTEKLIGIKHRNVNSHSLGVEGVDDSTGEMENITIIPKNTPIPCSKSAVFVTAHPTTEAGAAISIRVLEGESPNPRACSQIGLCRIEDLPAGLPEGSPVEITFSYTDDGRIQVAAFATDANRRATADICRDNALDNGALEHEAELVSKMDIV